MAVNIPQVITPDSASGAQVIDGCLKFDESKGQYLKFTPSASGNRRTQTLSVWIKNTYNGSNNKVILGGGDNASGPRHNIYHDPTKRFGITQNPTGSSNDSAVSVAIFRDFSGWQHLVVSLDCTLGQSRAQVRIYVNGKLQENGEYAGASGSASYITDQDGIFNTISKRMYLGHYAANPGDPAEFDGYMAQYHWIDGLALGPEYFGYSDPLTNTWRPKKFKAEGTTINDGTQWSSGGGSGLYSGSTWGPTFDGTPAATGSDVAHSAYVTNSGTSTITFPKPITGVLRFRACQGSNSPSTGNSRPYVTLSDGQEIRVDGANNAPSDHSFGYVSGITTLTITGTSAQGMNLLYLDVDGVVMEDSTTQNLDFGTNGVYLPFDGSAPIGQDQSGKGNNYTPVNFGGSASIEKATGAKPILNTINGGNIARPGVFGSDVGYRETVSSSSGGGNPYIFDGRGTQPTLSFIRGATYVFDYSSATSHPLRFATAADAAGSTQYTDGTSVSGNVISFTVPHNAPNTLYYYCTNHSGMGNSISVTTDETKADPYAWKCTLAIPFIGDTKDHSGNINCTVSSKATGSDNLTFSTPGDMFYGSPAKLLGNGSSNSRVTIASGAFGFGTGDFTIEFWGHFTATGDQGNRNARIITPQSESGTYIQILTSNSNATVQLNNVDIPNAQALNKTRHYVFQRSGTTGELIVDGVLVDTGTENRDFPDVAYQVGRYSDTNGGASMYMADLRVYTGVKKYSTTGKATGDPIFVPASTNPDILPDSPSGVAVKTQLTKIAEGSVAFDGSGDSLKAPDSSDLAFGTGEFTVEMFFYANTVSGNDVLYDSRAATGNPTDGFSIVRNSDQLRTYTSGDYKITPSTFRVATNRWYHLAITRESTTQKMYIDGELVGSATVSNDFSQNKATIGSDVGTGEGWDGFISNVRLIKGTALYTTDFTPPTSPLTNVTNTKLLCCQSSTSNTQASVIPNLTNFPAPYSASARFGSYKEYTTVNKNATSGTTLPMSNPTHYGGKALDLSSGGFQITTVNSATEDFFMGMWVHFDTYETSKQFGIDIAGNYVFFETLSSGAVKVRHTGDGGSSSSNTSLDDGNWHHIALSRTNDTLYGFVDGTAVVSDNGGTSGNSVAANSKFNFWGADNNFTSYNINGQIIDAFIYIGQGVSSYTNPTAPLVGNDGTINHFSGFSDTQAYFISPCVDITGSEANSITGSFTDIAGASTGTATNFNPFNTDIDTVRGQESNYCTINEVSDSNLVLSNGNLTFDRANSADWESRLGTLPMTSGGKWYYEIFLDNAETGNNNAIVEFGFATRNFTQYANYLGTDTESWAYQNNGSTYGQAFHNNSQITNYGSNAATGDTLALSLDLSLGGSNGVLTFYKNGISMGTAYTNIDCTRDYFPAFSAYYDGKATCNFGQKPFKFPPPDGFQPLTSSTARPDTVVARSDKYFNTVLYTGNGASTPGGSGGNQFINTVVKPDLIWIKDLTQAHNHNWYDTTRGEGSILMSDSDSGNVTNSTDAITFIGDTGFRLGDNGEGTQSLELNKNGNSYVCWNWYAGGSSANFNKDGIGYASAADVPGLAANTASVTTNKCSIGTKQGFSIINYTLSTGSQSIGHGLDQIPEVSLAKCIDAQTDWYFRIKTLDGVLNGYIILNGTAGITGSFSPTATQVSAAYTSGTQNWIAYNWHSVPGFLKIGTFTGNNNADGTYVDLGFKPAMLIVKRHDGSGDWVLWDNKRNPLNPVNRQVWPYTSSGTYGAYDQVGANYPIDFLSNGFKMRSNDADINGSAGYFYMAWAETPSFNLFGATANAR